jgi:hypothetical protein
VDDRRPRRADEDLVQSPPPLPPARNRDASSYGSDRERRYLWLGKKKISLCPDDFNSKFGFFLGAAEGSREREGKGGRRRMERRKS